MEFHVDREEVVHPRYFDVASTAGVSLVDDFGDGGAVCAAHDGVGGAVDDEDGGVDLLPRLAEVERLQLLVEGGGATVLAVWGVVPQ
jgi:hypothetical protein